MNKIKYLLIFIIVEDFPILLFASSQVIHVQASGQSSAQPRLNAPNLATFSDRHSSESWNPVCKPMRIIQLKAFGRRNYLGSSLRWNDEVAVDSYKNRTNPILSSKDITAAQRKSPSRPSVR